MAIATRTFSADDQLAFARLSGDYNPIHLDPVAARRLIFGRAVVHGMYLVLWALDHWLGDAPERLRLTALEVNFLRPLGVDEPAEARVVWREPPSVRIDVMSEGLRLLNIQLTWEPDRAKPVEYDIDPAEPTVPRQRTIEELAGATGGVPMPIIEKRAASPFPSSSALSSRFAAVARAMPGGQVGFLLAASRLVGMEAPGMHSVFRGLKVAEHSGSDGPELTYDVVQCDERFSLVTLNAAGGGLAGTILAAVRPRPAAQMSYDVARGLVAVDEFRGQRALVVGGSRGVGQAAVTLLAAGGAEVKFTYHVGEDEARRLAGEIASGGGTAACFAYDVLKDGADLSRRLDGWEPTLLCYCATPFIFRGVQGRFSGELLRRFCDFYLTGFFDAFHAAMTPGQSLQHVLYPSSVAVEDVPPGMAEYAAAKSAGEALCRSLQKAHPRVRFHVPRFERLATDQTARLQGAAGEDAADAVLKVLRQMR